MELRTDEPVAEGVKRICTELVEASRSALGGLHKPDDDIHAARKSFKKVRAILRALRPALGESIYQRNNDFFRDLGRALSEYRESFVQVKTLDIMVAKFPEELDTAPIQGLRKRLAKAHRRRVEGLLEGDRAEAVISRLARADEEIANWPVDGYGGELLYAGIEKTYRRGRQEHSAAEEEPSSTNLHAWRKRVKYLWYQLRLVQQAWPEILGPLEQALHGLANDLGDDHDYADFKTRVIDSGQLRLAEKTERKLHKAMNARRGELQASAFTAARRIYAEKPGQFADRLGHYIEQTWPRRS